MPVSEITSEGAKFNAQIIFRGTFEVLNYGFVWGEKENPTKEDSDRVIYAENIQSTGFSEMIETTLKEGTAYFVRAFVETEDFIVYGENVSFISLGSKAPNLLDFSPKRGNLEDTIRLSGANFGRIKSNIEVEINQIKVEIADFEETEISVLVPGSLSAEQSTISVSVSGNTASFDEKFNLLRPVINTLTPTNVTFGSPVVIEGANFNTKPNKLSIAFIGTKGLQFPAEIISLAENRLEIKVPLNIGSRISQVSISMNNFEVTGDQNIAIQGSIINSFSPQSGKTLTEITIVGENFSTVMSNNIVRIDGYPAEVVSAENTKLIVIIPDQQNHIYSSRQAEISVEVLSSETLANDPFMITDKWFRLGDLPFDKYTWKGLTINSEGYVLLPNGLWRYNPLTSIWTELTAFPDTRRFSPGIFSISDKIYLGAGVTPGNNRYNILKDFWEYSVESNSWIQKNDFPGAPRASPIAFSIGANGYMGAGEFDGDLSCCYNDVWQYDADSDSWQTISSFPLPYAEFGGYFRMVTTALNDEMYVGLGSSGIQGETNNHIYKYNSVSEEWIRIEDYPSRSDNSHFDGVAFTVDNQAFFGSGAYPDVLWSYDGSRWNAQKSQTRAGRNGGFSFVVNNIAYLGGGADFNQFWSFDPSQPD
jgi:hypothetical protein